MRAADRKKLITRVRTRGVDQFGTQGLRDLASVTLAWLCNSAGRRQGNAKGGCSSLNARKSSDHNLALSGMSYFSDLFLSRIHKSSSALDVQPPSHLGFSWIQRGMSCRSMICGPATLVADLRSRGGAPGQAGRDKGATWGMGPNVLERVGVICWVSV
jgi:hypothetical protein